VKRVFALIISALLVLSFAACDKNEGDCEMNMGKMKEMNKPTERHSLKTAAYAMN